MIILFEENESLFQNLGLGLLKDAKSCVVKEGLNDTFELEMQYPIDGQNFSKIVLNRIIFTKSNPYSEAQPFRIDSISKPINGIITVKAVHISYDMNGIPVKPIRGGSPKDVLDNIQNGSLIPHNFKFYTDITTSKTFKTSNYYNMRAVLMGSDESFLEVYKGELLFDKFNVNILSRRGSNKGASVRYSKNMKDLTHEVNYERLYNGVYPFYHKEETEVTTDTSSDGFKQVYIVGSKPYQDGWLSYTPDGEPYHPIDESPVQIATEGDYKDKVFTWNTTTQRYSERVYNEMVDLVSYVTDLINPADKPSWIYIDVGSLPSIVVKANTNGYFKLATDTDWSKKLKGEVVFQGSILNATDGLIMYFSEVIPTSETSTETETANVTHVELDDKIIWLKTDVASEMKYNRILCLDLTSEFEETPDKEKLEAKANEYIEENKIGQYKYDTKVSFVDLASTTEGTIYDKMETVELGDTVRVIYEGLGVDVELRVISTTYNAITDKYEDIELGEKPEKISASSVQTGDNVSSLTNDVGYTDVTTVNKLIAKTITADLIQAKNAKLSKAQIEEIQAARIKITGMLEATQFELDTLVAKMLTADNAIIKQTLEAGTVKVKGDITITKGEISIISGEEGDQKVFHVDRDGNLTANAVSITGGELNINDTFRVTQDGVLYAQGASVSGDIYITSGSITLGRYFEVTPEGTITANAGEIAGFTISKDLVSGFDVGRIRYGVRSIDDTLHDGVYIGTDGIRLGAYFYVTPDGTLHADNAIISGEIEATTGSIAGFDILSDAIQKGNTGSRVIVSPGRNITLFNVNKDWSFLAGAEFTTLFDVDTYTSAKFAVSKDGYVYASALNIRGGSINIHNDNVATFTVDEYGRVTASNISITGGSIVISNNNTPTFVVNSSGKVSASDIDITGGSIVIKDDQNNVKFRVTELGEATCSDINIIGGEINLGVAPSYSLDRITDIDVIYTVLENISGIESGDYKSVLYDMDLSSLEQDTLPESCGNLSAGTLVPKFRVEYWDREPDPGEPDGYDYYWYVGTVIYNGIEYDRWVKVEDPNWGDQSFNTDERTFIYCTKVVTKNSASGAYFYVDREGNLTATSANINGRIESEEGHIAGFTITDHSLYSDYNGGSTASTSTKGVYIGDDSIRLGDRIDKSFTSSNFTINGSYVQTYGRVSIYDANENYAGSVFVLHYDRVSSERRIKVNSCDSNYNILSNKNFFEEEYILPAGSTSIDLDPVLQLSQYFRFYHIDEGSNITGCYLTLKMCPGFIVNSIGELYCTNATVRGRIEAETGSIAGFTINPGYLQYNDNTNKVYLGTDGIEIGPSGNPTFRVTRAGEFEIGNNGSPTFKVTSSGDLTIQGNFSIASGGYIASTSGYWPSSWNISQYLYIYYLQYWYGSQYSGISTLPNDGYYRFVLNKYNFYRSGDNVYVSCKYDCNAYRNSPTSGSWTSYERGCLWINFTFNIYSNSITYTTILWDAPQEWCIINLGPSIQDPSSVPPSYMSNFYLITINCGVQLTRQVVSGFKLEDTCLSYSYLTRYDGDTEDTTRRMFSLKASTSETYMTMRSYTNDSEKTYVQSVRWPHGISIYTGTEGDSPVIGGTIRASIRYDFGYNDFSLTVSNSCKGYLKGTWYGTSGQAITSDRKAKHNIEDLPEVYSNIFDKLRPVRFKYNDNTHDRYHTGLIAQDLEQAIITSGLDTKDMAAFIKSETKDGEYEYSIRYSELHALEIYEIQKLKKQVKDLQDELAALKGGD